MLRYPGVQSTRQQAAVFGIALLAAIVSALLSARGAGFLAAKLLHAHQGEAAASLGRSGGLRSLRKSASAILQRNVFDAEAGPLDARPTSLTLPAEQAPEEAVVADGQEALCGSEQATLVAVFFREDAPELSMVALKQRGESFVVEQELPRAESGLRLLEVREKGATIQPSSGPACRLEMFAEEDATAPAVAQRAAPRVSPSPAASTRTSSIPDAEYDAGIQKVGEYKYNVSRELLNKVLGNRLELIRTARVVPHEENGRVVGVKLYGIRNKSMLSRVGMKNGDMLRTINGFDMTSPDTALEAYARLRSADNLTVSVVRGGKPVSLDYRVR